MWGIDVSSRARSGLLLLTAGLVALAVVVVLMLTDHATVRSAQELGHVPLGRPLSWVRQDQSGLDPPYPVTLGLGSPLEAPAHVAWGALGLDVAACWLALVLLGAASSRARGARTAHRG